MARSEKFEEMKVQAKEKWQDFKVKTETANEKYCFCLKTWKAKALLFTLVNILLAVSAFFGPAWAIVDFCALTDLTFQNSGSNFSINTEECKTYIGWSLVPGDTLVVGDGAVREDDDDDDDEVEGIPIFQENENGTLVIVDYLFLYEANFTVEAFFGEELSVPLHVSRGFAMLTTLITLVLPVLGFFRPSYAARLSMVGILTCVLAVTMYIVSDEADLLEEKNDELVGSLDCDELEESGVDAENCEDKVFRKFGPASACTIGLVLSLLVQYGLYKLQLKSTKTVEAKEVGQEVKVGVPEISGTDPGISL